jgi:hypothetical protein
MLSEVSRSDRCDVGEKLVFGFVGGKELKKPVLTVALEFGDVVSTTFVGASGAEEIPICDASLAISAFAAKTWESSTSGADDEASRGNVLAMATLFWCQGVRRVWCILRVSTLLNR